MCKPNQMSEYKQYLKENLSMCQKCGGFGFLDPDVHNLPEWKECNECDGGKWFNKKENRAATEQEIFMYHAPEPKCIGCRASAEQLNEYKVLGSMEGMTATEFMLENEGTYDKFVTNRFYCTSCYIKAGQPSIHG